VGAVRIDLLDSTEEELRQGLPVVVGRIGVTTAAQLAFFR